MRVVQPHKIVTVEFTEEEATVLCALVGGIPWNFDTHAGRILRDFYDGLDGALPDRTDSFVDFFEGEVRVKR